MIREEGIMDYSPLHNSACTRNVMSKHGATISDSSAKRRPAHSVLWLGEIGLVSPARLAQRYNAQSIAGRVE